MMKEADALDILRAQSCAVGTPDVHTGRVRVWIRGSDEAVDVQIGREVYELVEGKVSFEDIRARREDEAVVWTE
jgi:hypothetical protein